MMKAAPSDQFRSWAATHPGAVRKYNEDRFLNRPDLGLWAVADGAGGHQSGDVASSRIVELLEAIPAGLSASQLLAEVRLRVSAAHADLRAEADRRGGGVMIASTVVVLLARDNHYACLWAGDSRAYLLRQGRLVQLTRDHSLVQELVDAGAIAPEEAEGHPRANVITRAVGSDSDDVELDKAMDRLVAGDRFLLCSDGLCKTLDEAELATLMAAPDGVPPPELLVAAALGHHVNDNVTAVAIEVASIRT